jgi:hypothetical protein
VYNFFSLEFDAPLSHTLTIPTDTNITKELRKAPRLVFINACHALHFLSSTDGRFSGVKQWTPRMRRESAAASGKKETADDTKERRSKRVSIHVLIG